MKTFPVTFSRTYVVVLLLVLLPISLVGVFLVALMSVPRLPDWGLLASCFVFMGVNIFLVVRAVKSWGTVPAEASVGPSGIAIKLLGSSPFYPRKRFEAGWDGLENVSTNYDPQHAKRFYLIRFKAPAAGISLMPTEAADEATETPFGEALMGYVEQYNKAHMSSDTRIRRRGFYDAWWAKGLTICSYLFIAIAVLGYFTGSNRFPLWRLIQVFCFSGMWLAAYYANRRHSRA